MHSRTASLLSSLAVAVLALTMTASLYRTAPQSPPSAPSQTAA